jgi:acetyl-CoA synthetase
VALEKPEKRALLWVNDNNEERLFTFREIKRLTDTAANMLVGNGVKKGDKVMLILKRHYEFWISIIALHKIGAIAIPATHLLTKKDIVYRNNAADVSMVIATSCDDLKEHVEDAEAESPTLKRKMIVGERRDGWLNFWDEMDKYGPDWKRPEGDGATENGDIMLLYFTSGTAGMPKMVAMNYLYPLGHIVTTVY